MRNYKNSNPVIDWITIGGAAYFIGSAIAGAIKRKRAQQGVGFVEGSKFKRFVYGYKAIMSNGDVVVGDVVYASESDVEKYIASRLKPGLNLRYNAANDCYEVTERETGKEVATIYIKSYFYYV